MLKIMPTKKKDSKNSLNNGEYRKRKNSSFKKFILKWLFVSCTWMTIISAIVISYYAYDLPNIKMLHDEYRTGTFTQQLHVQRAEQHSGQAAVVVAGLRHQIVTTLLHLPDDLDVIDTFPQHRRRCRAFGVARSFLRQ